ncbi:hypothetical protein JNK13_08675 [bacterium]|nr:hypothetical protein [bacterium]
MGAPFAVAILEELVKRGIREFILVSIAGGLGDSFQVGDYILPTTAISDEGTSANYLQDTGSTSHAMPAQPSQNILNQFILSAKIEPNSAFGIHRTTIASTDAPYREIPEKIYNLMRRGARTIDMEYSALLSAANFHKVSLQAVFAVSDVAAESGFASRKLKQALTQISSAVIDFCRDSVFENENTPLHRP